MNDINELREKLDSIDAELMRLYSQRMEVSLRIAEYKRENSLPVEDPSREAEVLSSRTEKLPQPFKAGGELMMRLLMVTSSVTAYQPAVQVRSSVTGKALHVCSWSAASR